MFIEVLRTNHILHLPLSFYLIGRTWTATIGFGTPTTDEGKYNSTGLFGDYTRDARTSNIDGYELFSWALSVRLCKD